MENSGTAGSFGFTRDDSSSDDTSSRASTRSTKQDSGSAQPGNGTGEKKEPFNGGANNPSPNQLKKPGPGQGSGGVFLLHAAIKKHSLSEFKKLMEKEPMDKVDEEGRTILHLAAKEAQVDIVKLILKKKNWLNFDQQDREGFTALHYAIMAGDIKTFEILLKAGASTRAVTRTGSTVRSILSLTIW
jgi:ankyrin repeat protein